MRDLSRREFLAGTAALLAGSAVGRSNNSERRKWLIGHHFWNWDRAWDKGEFLEKRLILTRQTGYDGFEAKPNEIGLPAEAVREKCAKLGIRCAAIGGALKEAIDYAYTAGAKIVRSGVPKEETKQWVDYAGERGIIIVIHPHIGRPGQPGAVETREDLLRYLDERPGVFACPDTGHLALCGSDPVRTIRDLGPRCRYIHLKDIRPDMVGARTRKGEKFCELGTGALNLEGVLKALEDIDYNGWVMVERDNRVPDYVQSARNMRILLREMNL
ncbi:MAG TPA: sugar phosphate isomerase/epimerase family protein [Sedimentisphaerales bacterium]|nr:sugar phosphate isomerase/epimerase family protein [Sedimentisphaerales bacterium]